MRRTSGCSWFRHLPTYVSLPCFCGPSGSTASHFIQSLHASSVLQRVTIASLTQPPPASLAYSLTIIDPPFGVIAMTDRPFLASITLEWASSRNKPTQVEHWVEVSRSPIIPLICNDELTGDSWTAGREHARSLERSK